MRSAINDSEGRGKPETPRRRLIPVRKRSGRQSGARKTAKGRTNRPNDSKFRSNRLPCMNILDGTRLPQDQKAEAISRLLPPFCIVAIGSIGDSATMVGFASLGAENAPRRIPRFPSGASTCLPAEESPEMASGLRWNVRDDSIAAWKKGTARDRGLGCPERG